MTWTCIHVCGACARSRTRDPHGSRVASAHAQYPASPAAGATTTVEPAPADVSGFKKFLQFELQRFLLFFKNLPWSKTIPVQPFAWSSVQTQNFIKANLHQTQTETSASDQRKTKGILNTEKQHFYNSYLCAMADRRNARSR